jgi:hypothetical protein
MFLQQCFSDLLLRFGAPFWRRSQFKVSPLVSQYVASRFDLRLRIEDLIPVLVQIATENQEETDRYWNAIVGNGGTESQCGWCKDRWGLCWQITPRALTDALAAGGGEARRAFEAMMTMKKIDIAAIEAARRG